MSPAKPSSRTTAASVEVSPGRRGRKIDAATAGLLAVAAACDLAGEAAAAAWSSSKICRRIFARSIGLVMAAAMTQERPP